jgi:predicted DCC family thiol-disulfide oxidoreductase YuxK
MRKLYVLYDSRCELCCRLQRWLSEQESWVELKTMPAGSAEVRKMFPELEEIASADDLVVVSDEGEVYLDNRAWIMCLYALVKYREWACRLAHPLLLPLARQAYEALSRNRYSISRWLGTNSNEAIAAELRHVSLPPCSTAGEETISDYLR